MFECFLIVSRSFKEETLKDLSVPYGVLCLQDKEHFMFECFLIVSRSFKTRNT